MTARAESSCDGQLEASWTRAFRWACCLTGDETQAQDLRQDAALRAIRGYRTFRSGGNFGAWFRQIMVNCHRDAYRRRRRRPLAFAGDAATVELLAPRESSGDQEAHELRRLTVQQVRAEVDRLPEPFRHTAQMHYLEDRTYPEIAQLLGCPIGTVRSRLNRSRHLLQEALR